MAETLYKDLAWLPEINAEFDHNLNDLRKKDDVALKDIIPFTRSRLDLGRLNKVARVLKSVDCSDDAIKQAGLTPISVSILSTSTYDLIHPAIAATGLRHGLLVRCAEDLSFNQIMADVSDAQSAIYAAENDVIIVALDPYAFFDGVHLDEDVLYQHSVDFIDFVKGQIAQYGGDKTVVFQTIPNAPDSVFGHIDPIVSGTYRNVTHRFNQFLFEGASRKEHLILDVAHLAETVGLHAWHDPVLRHVAKLPFSQNYVALYADHVCRILGALKGKSRKCLVLDLDNTLWGGVIGDDGLSGIRLGQGDAVGEAHLDIQKMAKTLKARGIVLAVSSKNEDAVARRVFDEHPEMLLKQDDIAVFQANWEDKARNIKAIAETLNIGTDSLVFLDDNPAERFKVRQDLPEVAVPEIGEDPSYYPRYIHAAGYFESVSFSDEDKKRADFYTQNAKRAELSQSIGDYDDYLASLDMSASIKAFDDVNLPRIAQLINKSNQFNLTTRRYTEDQVKQMMADPSIYTLQARLVDRFGDNGVVSIVICRDEGDGLWHIDTWLMSCRVLKRKLEEAVLAVISRDLSARGGKVLRGEYIPTAKNMIVEHHYRDLGFAQGGAQKNGDVTYWEKDIADYKFEEETQNIPIDIKD